MTDLANSKDRILLVDDHKGIRDMVSKILAYMGYEVVAARNGKEALRLFFENPFNLVFTDLNMPEVDGLALAFSIKQRSPHTPVVLITASGWDAAQEGPVDFVMQKPFTLIDLEHTAQKFLRRSERL